jgi:protein-L-isoaspartate(D-aspartate) O-methyltransferase
MTTTPQETARFNMINQQIRPCDVTHAAVLQTLHKVPREQFVPTAFQSLAFSDTHIPLDAHNEMMKPLQEALMLQALDIQVGERVLEIGTGSGFVTACLLAMGGQVTSYEIDPTLGKQAARVLEKVSQDNAAILEVGDIFQADLPEASYDVIAVTGSMPTSAECFLSWLAPGGRMYYIEGEPPMMQAKLVTKSSAGLQTTILGETLLSALQQGPQPEPFMF